MKPAQIKSLLILHGKTQSEIADALGRDRTRVNAVVNNRSSCHEIRLAVAKVVNKDINDIWPDEQYRRPNGRIMEPVLGVA